ncbi:TetR/AcrR family transcriptional regulator [Agromyces bauzanensis]|nr:TetR/AcrR family transcriptional regulator [Agromyces bauzanensis]
MHETAAATAEVDNSARPYHHGALRSELIAESLKTISERGVAAVSLRQLARDAGVTPAAPYHHFPDRAALFAAIIAEGHTLLYKRLGDAVSVAVDATAALRDMLVAYARFAADHPAHMRVMLRPEAGDPARHPEVADTRAVDLLRATVVAAQREGALPNADPEPWVQLFWSLAVGYVTLWVDGPVEARCHALGTTPEEMIERVGDAIASLLRRPRG